MTRCTLRAALVAAWGWGALNALSSAPPVARPSAPYARFAGRSFAPSAASFDPVTRRVLVLSDSDTTLYRYELGPAGLARPRGERHESLRLPAGVEVAKLEGMTRLPTGDFLAVTAFDRPDSRYRKLLRFSYGLSALTDASVLSLDEAALDTAVRDVAGKPLSRVDAVAVDRTGTKVLLGLGDDSGSQDARPDVGLVARCPFEDGRVGAPEAVVRLSAADSVGDPTEALSDLQLDARGDSFLVLTRNDAPTDRPSGHLFRVPASVLLGIPPLAPFSLGAPLREFRARPEGLAVEPSGALVVVFDDHDAEPPAAGHESSDGLVAVIDPGP